MLPAYAGMIRCPSRRSGTLRRAPRVCGDDPRGCVGLGGCGFGGFPGESGCGGGVVGGLCPCFAPVGGGLGGGSAHCWGMDETIGIQATEMEFSGSGTVTRAKAARLLGVDPRTLAKAIEAGQVPVVVLGQVVRVPVSWLRSQLRV